MKSFTYAIFGAVLAALVSYCFIFSTHECSALYKVFNGRSIEVLNFLACLAKTPGGPYKKFTQCRPPCASCDDLVPTEFEISNTTFLIRSTATADFDGDGQLDDIAHCQRKGLPVKALDPKKAPKGFVHSLILRFASIALGEVETANNLTVFVHLNQGQAGREWQTVPVHTSLSGPDCTVVKVADMDNDGDQDLVVTGHMTNDVWWYENLNGNGLGWKEHQVIDEESILCSPHGVDVYDFDNDGDADMIVTTTSTRLSQCNAVDDSLYANRVICMENVDGKGTKWKAAEIAIISESFAVSFGDFDLDGKMDVAYASRDGDKDVEGLLDKSGWIRNTGHPAYATWEVIPFQDPLSESHFILSLDFDKNGEMDVLLGSAYSIAMYTNHGQHFTKHMVWEGWPLQGVKDFCVGDIDMDGDIDIVAPSFFNDFVILFENVSPANATEFEFLPHVLSECEPGVGTCSIGDVDHDGKPEVVLGNYNYPGYLRYLKPQKTTSPGAPLVTQWKPAGLWKSMWT
ncbi:hypothetical protein CYMTET_56472 [Cymbomonas tetramitiformis]|uniref:FG-GAP repeat protein n=1 Tax=Cymbomonas tetramitiformis TaxID=36881 RepID=A0AAE0BC31_9CHLO|nr:hypothetical protein CYMTET_56472 [Cymbomonas tetramitiformis]